MPVQVTGTTGPAGGGDPQLTGEQTPLACAVHVGSAGPLGLGLLLLGLFLLLYRRS